MYPRFTLPWIWDVIKNNPSKKSDSNRGLDKICMYTWKTAEAWTGPGKRDWLQSLHSKSRKHKFETIPVTRLSKTVHGDNPYKSMITKHWTPLDKEPADKAKILKIKYWMQKKSSSKRRPKRRTCDEDRSGVGQEAWSWSFTRGKLRACAEARRDGKAAVHR